MGAEPEQLADTYGQARASFLAAADAVGAVLGHHPHPLGGLDGEDLSLDTAWVGSGDPDRLVIVVSGTHGVEGFAGSALQTTWMRTVAVDDLPPDLAVLLVHALNPYGFSWMRRVNEDNVDLNRNFCDFSSPPANPGYAEVADLLVPRRWDDETQATTAAALIDHAGRVGFERMQELVSAGQYTHPDGVFYGGDGPTWSHETLRSLVSAAREIRHVAVIDLHTGLGPWGHGELISSDPADSHAYRRAARLWGDDVTSLVEGDSVSARLHGEWLPAVARWLEGPDVTGVALEFGTVDPLTVLAALRADAWLHAHGDPTAPEAEAVRAQLRAAFADDDPAWIHTLWERFSAVLAAAIEGLGNLDL